MIVIGIVLLLLGFLLKVAILWTLGHHRAGGRPHPAAARLARATPWAHAAITGSGAARPATAAPHHAARR